MKDKITAQLLPDSRGRGFSGVERTRRSRSSTADICIALEKEPGDESQSHYFELNSRVFRDRGDTVVIKAIVHSGSIGDENSGKTEGYFRIVRKQHFKAIERELIKALKVVDFDVLASFKAEILEESLLAIEDLSETAKARRFEGNGCELFRMLRDAMNDDGWKKLGRPGVCASIVSAINAYCLVDEITPEVVVSFRQSLEKLGMETCISLKLLTASMCQP